MPFSYNVIRYGLLYMLILGPKQQIINILNINFIRTKVFKFSVILFLNNFDSAIPVNV